MMHDYKAAPDALAGRTILITGAGAGIGRAVAIACAEHGASVVLLGRTVKKLEAVYDRIAGAGHAQPAIYPMDLLGANADHYDELAERLGTELGGLDGVLNNAGLLGKLSPIECYDLQTWAEVIQVNLNAPFLLTRACLPLLKRSPDASVVFVSSSVGRRSRAYWGAYAVSKFACEGLMQTLADELEGSTVRVNSINPGAVRTAMRAGAYPAEDPATLPVPRAIASAFLFLLGPESRGLTGRAFDAQPPGVATFSARRSHPHCPGN